MKTIAMRDPAKTSAIFSPPSRGQILAAMACLAAAAAAWGDASSILRAPLGFVLMGFIPGWLLARGLLRHDTVTPEEVGMAAAVLSIPLSILARLGAGTLGISGDAFVVVWGLVCAVGAFLIPRPGERQSSPDLVAWLIAFGLAMVVILPAAVNPTIRSWGDAQFHAQVVHEILPRTLPAENPAYFGMPLIYPWLFHIWAAALVDAMGVTSYQVFVWINGAMMAALSLGVYRLAALYWPGLLYRRLAPPVLALGMNAVGWLTFSVYTGLSMFVGEVRGIADLKKAFDLVLGNPTADTVTMTLIYKSPHELCSFLYKYLCANTLAPSLTLGVAGFVLASLFLKGGGRGRLLALGLVVATATVIHPLAGLPVAGGCLAGLFVTFITSSIRRRCLAAATVVGLALLLAAPILAFMSGEGLSASEKMRLHPSAVNLSVLIQGLLVIGIPALWGWWELRRRQAALASFGAGFGLAVLAAALIVDFMGTGEMYIVYPAYLGVAFFAAGGIAAAISALQRRRLGALAWVLAGLLFLPTSFLLIQGFARDDRGPGSHGHPDTPDEIAVFDYLRDQSPPDVVVVDSQATHLPPCAAYSHRRAFYGGYYWAELVGYPAAEMQRRERAVINLFFESDVSDSTWSILNAVKRPVYVVARGYYPHWPLLRGLPDPPMPDVIGKLDSFPDMLEPISRTSTITLYRYRGGN